MIWIDDLLVKRPAAPLHDRTSDSGIPRSVTDPHAIMLWHSGALQVSEMALVKECLVDKTLQEGAAEAGDTIRDVECYFEGKKGSWT